MSNLVTTGGIAAILIGVGGALYFGRLTIDVARNRVVVLNGHIYRVTAVDENGDPTLRRIR